MVIVGQRILISFCFIKIKLSLILLIFYLVLKEEPKRKYVSESINSPPLSSSVFCSIHRNNSRRCIFRNLCYNFYSNFMFLMTEKSIISGLTNKNDFKNIFATSVLNHSALPLKIALYTKKLNDVLIYKRDVFLLHRFKPDNIMHVIHDDVLPLYSTYRDLCSGNISDCVNKYDVAFSDENTKDTFLEWYSSLSINEPFQLTQLNKSVTYCFASMTVGLSIDSTIFQYGFQGRRGSTGLSMQQAQLYKQFKGFMLNHFNLKNSVIDSSIVFIGRKLNRKIINEEYVEKMIVNKYKTAFNTSVKVKNMDLSINSSKDMVEAIAKAKVFVGIHGSGMFLSIFLPENSIVIEMFPYSINKESVSPIYYLSLVPGIWLRYFSWENNDAINSFPHPEYPCIFGGLSSLNRNERMNIFRHNVDVLSRGCCDDPLFLSRMYQDTVVDNTFLEVLNSAFNAENEFERYDPGKILIQEWFFPGIVENVTCHRNVNSLFLSWNHPLNIDVSSNPKYDIVVETVNQSISVITSNYSLELTLDSDIFWIKIWIKCILVASEGFDTFLTC